MVIHGPYRPLLVFKFGFSTEFQGELAQIGFRKQKQKDQKAKATIIVERVDLQTSNEIVKSFKCWIPLWDFLL